MIYVVSDVHGCYTELMLLLDKAGFDESKDELIIAGDIVDRGSESLDMLRLLEKHPSSYTFLKGNHDAAFADYCRITVDIYRKHRKGRESLQSFLFNDCLWNYVNGYFDHYGTLEKLLDKVKIKDLEKWTKLIDAMPYIAEREIGGKKYIIVHAGYITENKYLGFRMCGYGDSYLRANIAHFYLWAREDGIEYGGKDGVTVVFGHTPTIFDSSIFYNEGKVWTKRIKKKRFINIDCGLVYDDKNSNLALLRLDDEKVFYLYDK